MPGFLLLEDHMAKRSEGAAPLGGTLTLGPESKSRDRVDSHALKNKQANPVEETAQLPAELEQALTSNEMANALRVSPSWLAKARMRGDGPPYSKIGRSIRYFPSRVAPWLKARQRSSTSE